MMAPEAEVDSFRKLVGVLAFFVHILIIPHPVLSQSTAAGGCVEMDVVLVIPTPSDSTEFQELKSFLTTVLQQLNIGGPSSTIQIGLVAYRGTAQSEFVLGQFTTSSTIVSEINGLVAISAQGSDVADALNLALQMFQPGKGARTGIPQVVVIFEDSVSDNQQASYTAEYALNAQSIISLSVGIGGNTDQTELDYLSTGSQYEVAATDYSTLMEEENAFLSALCSIRTRTCHQIADVCFLLDQSTSIVDPLQGSYANWYTIDLGFVENVTAAFPIAPVLTQVGVVKFSSANKVSISWYLDTYQTNRDIAYAVSQLQILGGETDIADGLKLSREGVLFNTTGGARTGVRKILIMITDGEANINVANTLPEANATKALGVEIFVIGVTNKTDVAQLTAIASLPTSTHLFYASTFSVLNTFLPQLLNAACDQQSTVSTVPTTTPTTTTTMTTTTTTMTTSTTTTASTTMTTTTAELTATHIPCCGIPTTTTTTPTTTATTPPPTALPTITSTSTSTTTEITIPTTLTTTTIVTTTTTTTPTAAPTTPTTTTTARPVPQCSDQADVVFVLDTSGSLDPNSMSAILSFIVGVCQFFPVETGSVQVGLVTFGTTQELVFKLNANNNYPKLVTAINQVTYLGGSSNKADAFSFTLNTALSTTTGARKSVPDLIILISAASSPNETAALAEADLIRRAGITIATVSLGTWLDIDAMHSFSTFPWSYFSFQSSISSLANIESNVASLICNNGNPCSPNPCGNGGQCSVVFGYAWCTCKVGYGGPICGNTCSAPSDVIFAVDSSAGISQTNWDIVLNFITRIVQNLDIDSALPTGSVTGSRVGMVLFGYTATVAFQLNTYTTKLNLLQGIQQLYNLQTSNCAAAISKANNQMFTIGNGDRPTVPNYLVIITDGISDNTTGTLNEAMKARNNGINIVAVGIGSGYNYNELVGMASNPVNSNVITSPLFSSLNGNSTVLAINSLLCASFNYCQSSPCLNGATCTNIMGGYTCSPCPTNFTGINCERSCTGVLDLVFVLDASGSIEQDRFPLVLKYVQGIVGQLEISPTRTQVGVVYYANTSYVAFNLSTFTNQKDVVQAIGSIQFIGGLTDIAQAFRTLRNTMFLPSSGGRAGVHHAAVFITDAMADMEVSDTIPEAILTQNTEIQVSVVLIGEPGFVNLPMANSMASNSIFTNMIPVSSYYLLPNTVVNVISVTCNSVNECLPNPCNLGTCTDNYGFYTCSCPVNVTGYNCTQVSAEGINSTTTQSIPPLYVSSTSSSSSLASSSTQTSVSATAVPSASSSTTTTAPSVTISTTVPAVISGQTTVPSVASSTSTVPSVSTTIVPSISNSTTTTPQVSSSTITIPSVSSSTTTTTSVSSSTTTPQVSSSTTTTPSVSSSATTTPSVSSSTTISPSVSSSVTTTIQSTAVSTAPSLTVPVISSETVPSISNPTITVPAGCIIVPSISVPTFSIPTISIPTVPAGSVPTFPSVATPTIPSISSPTFPTISSPTFPTISSPTFPTFSSPTIPTISSPKIPSISSPTFPTISSPTIPTFSSPTFPSISSPTFPSISSPTFPSISSPKFSSVSIPTIPSISGQTFPTVSSPTLPPGVNVSVPVILCPTNPSVANPAGASNPSVAALTGTSTTPITTTPFNCPICNGNQILIQQRVDTGTTFFNQSWATMKSQLGSQTGDYWLGLDAIHGLTSCGHYQLKVNWTDTNIPPNTSVFVYDTFQVGDESSGYKLTIGNVSMASNTYDAFSGYNGLQFSTADHTLSGPNCAASLGGAWWYSATTCTCTACLTQSAEFAWNLALQLTPLSFDSMILYCNGN